jgi:serine/threonine protein kinase
MSTVNPYVDWLQIPASVSRPNHYELLGLPDFEDNEKKIKGAYYRRVAQVSVYQSGATAEACQTILVELAEARDCLTSASARSAYDARISQKKGVPAKKVKRHRRTGDRSTVTESEALPKLQPIQTVRPRQPARPGQTPVPAWPMASPTPAASQVQPARIDPAHTLPRSTAAGEAERRLQSEPTVPMLRRRISTDQQLAELRARSGRSPLGLFGLKRSAAEIVSDIAATRGLTAYQAQLVDDKAVDELIVGPFLLEHKLRLGNWGQVFLASRITTGETVTLRTLPPSFAGELGALRKRIEQVQQIESKYLQQPIECGSDGQRPYLVSQYIAGEDLSRLVERSGPLTVQQAVHCIGRLVESLDAARRAGLCHLELRPTKLLINRAGQLHLRDLALANIVSRRKQGEKNLIQLLRILPPEHLHFSAPEVLLNEGQPGFQADIYSAGCILFYLLTGRYVLHDSDPLHHALSGQAMDLCRLLGAEGAIPDVLQQCLGRMLARQPGDRFENYSGLHLALKEAYRSLESTKFKSSNLWNQIDELDLPEEKSQQPIRRYHVGRALASGAAVAGLLTGLALGGAYLLQSRQPESIPAPVPPVSTEKKGPTIVHSDTVEVPVVESHDVFEVR